MPICTLITHLEVTNHCCKHSLSGQRAHSVAPVVLPYVPVAQGMQSAMLLLCP
jgi:hypothetical protein